MYKLKHCSFLQSLPTAGRAEHEDEGEVPHGTRALGACSYQSLTTPKQGTTAELTLVTEPASMAVHTDVRMYIQQLGPFHAIGQFGSNT